MMVVTDLSPLLSLCVHGDQGEIEFKAVLFVPKKAPHDMFDKLQVCVYIFEHLSLSLPRRSY